MRQFLCIAFLLLSDQSTQQPTSQPTLNEPRFLVAKSEEKDRKVTDLSPFAIEKCIQSIAGHHGVKISLHNTLNTSKGVMRCQDLGICLDDEILDLKSEGFMHIRNIQVCRNGGLKRTNTYVLTFNTPVLPKKIKATYLSVNVEVYIPHPLRCYHCQIFGHHDDNCMKKPICGKCGGERHYSDDHNCKETSKCTNCNGPHPVFSRNCPTWKKEKEILSVKSDFFKKSASCRS